MGATLRAFIKHFRKPELTIIIPAYNAMPEFKECIDSILTQDLSPHRYEVILIDDGSTDGTGEYCDEISTRYENFTTMHEENSGSCSHPRNVGLEHVRGKYVFFCDADDYFYPHALSKMLSHAHRLKCDLGLFKIDKRAWNYDYEGLFNEMKMNCTIDDTPSLLYFFGVSRLIKRSLLEDNHIRFTEGAVPEDSAFSLECYLRAKNICVINDQYYYRHNKRPAGTSLSQRRIAKTEAWWPQYRTAITAYLKAATQACNMEAHPEIGARFCVLLERPLGVAMDGGIPEEGVSFLRNALAGHYTDDVRSRLTLRRLILFDAFSSSLPISSLFDIRVAIEEGRISFSPRGTYALTTFEGNQLFEGSLPKTKGTRLNSPNLGGDTLISAELDASGLSLEGRATLISPNNIEPSEAHIEFFRFGSESSTRMHFDATITSHETTTAYGSCHTTSLSWKSFIPVSSLSNICLDNRIVTGDFYLVFTDNEMQRIRIGAPRKVLLSAGSVENQFALHGRTIVKIYITKREKLCVKVAPIVMGSQLGVSNLEQFS